MQYIFDVFDIFGEAKRLFSRIYNIYIYIYILYYIYIIYFPLKIYSRKYIVPTPMGVTSGRSEWMLCELFLPRQTAEEEDAPVWRTWALVNVVIMSMIRFLFAKSA